MARSERRISRGLIVLLLLTIGLGVVAYIQRERRASAAAEPAPDASGVRAARDPAAEESAMASLSGGVDAFLVSAGNAAPAPQPTVVPQPSVPQPAAAPEPRPTPVMSIVSTADPLGDARALAETDPVRARRSANALLQSGQVGDGEAAATRQFIARLNDAIIFSTRRFASDEYSAGHSVAAGQTLRGIADDYDSTWEFIARINGLSDPRRLRAGQTLKVIRGPFHAVVHKRAFRMDVYLGPPGEPGAMFIRSFNVGLGAEDSTPTGAWLVETHKKIRNPTYFSPRGEGIIDADDPANPLGERWIGLTGIDGDAVGKSSYGIHGTIEPASIGRMESMGCIRLLNEDVELLFDMLVEGKSRVLVRD